MTWVRFLPPQLTEVIRPDEEPVLKTGQRARLACGFESHGFRSTDPVVQRRRLLAYTQTTMVRVHPGSLIQTPRYANPAERLGLNPSVCGFDSRLGHISKQRLGRQSADHLGLEPGMLWVRVPPEPFTSRPRGAVRSARHPVTVEIVGSNPIEDAY